MTDLFTIIIAIAAIILIMKIAAKVMKFLLILAVIGTAIYILANYGFLTGLF